MLVVLGVWGGVDGVDDMRRGYVCMEHRHTCSAGKDFSFLSRVLAMGLIGLIGQGRGWEE